MRVRSPDIRRCAQYGWCPPSVPADLRRAYVALPRSRFGWSPWVRRLGLGRTDGAADAEKQPTGLAVLTSVGLWAIRRKRLLLGRVEGVATHRHKRCFDRTRHPRFSSSSRPKRINSCLARKRSTRGPRVRSRVQTSVGVYREVASTTTLRSGPVGLQVRFPPGSHH